MVKYKHVKINERYKQQFKKFNYISTLALQEELVTVLRKADENVNFEKFARQNRPKPPPVLVVEKSCCVIL